MEAGSHTPRALMRSGQLEGPSARKALGPAEMAPGRRHYSPVSPGDGLEGTPLDWPLAPALGPEWVCLVLVRVAVWGTCSGPHVGAPALGPWA